jgi:hypothetical protein
MTMRMGTLWEMMEVLPGLVLPRLRSAAVGCCSVGVRRNILQSQYPFEISDDDDDGYSSVADDDDDEDGAWSLEQSDFDEGTKVDDDAISLGDCPGIDPDDDDGSNYLVTQPAIDDVDDTFFPANRTETKNTSHLTSSATSTRRPASEDAGVTA